MYEVVPLKKNVGTYRLVDCFFFYSNVDFPSLNSLKPELKNKPHISAGVCGGFGGSITENVPKKKNCKIKFLKKYKKSCQNILTLLWTSPLQLEVKPIKAKPSWVSRRCLHYHIFAWYSRYLMITSHSDINGNAFLPPK